MICRDPLAEYDAREPIERCDHGVDLYQRGCSICEYEREIEEAEEAEEDEEAAVPLALVGSVGTLLFWLFLAAPGGGVA